MLMFFPVQTEVLFNRWPVVNFVLMGLCVTGFVCFNLLRMGEGLFTALVLDGWNPVGLLGHVFLHGGFSHLFGNMIFLWVFGNALNEKMGQLPYLGFFFLAGLVAAVAHNLFDGAPAVGASGAINGVVGAYFVLYPTNRITCFWFFLFRTGTVQVAGYVLILLWFVTDLFGALSGSDIGVAYWAHVGGFLCGVACGCALVRSRRVTLGSYDNPDLLTLLNIRHRAEPEAERVDTTRPGEIAFDCPDCGSHLRVLESQLGTSVTCWSCKTAIRLEEE